MFPPRTPSRDATNPPQQLLQLLGIPSDITHLTYNFSEHALPWISFIVHYSFLSLLQSSIFISQKIYKNHIRLWCFIWYSYLDRFHLILMPMMHVVPNAFNQPFSEHLSEFSDTLFG